MDTTIDEESQKTDRDIGHTSANSLDIDILPTSQMVSLRIYILLELALVLRGQLANAKGCRHRHVIVDSSDLDAGIVFSGESWVMENGGTSADGLLFGESTMRTSSNGDSVEFVFKGSSVRPHVIPCPCG